jgi:protein TonB
MPAQTFAPPPSERALSLALVIGLHVAAGATLLTLAQPVIQQFFSPPMQVQMVSDAPPQPEAVPEPPKPMPMKQKVERPQPKPTPVKPTPTPVIQSEATAPANTQAITAPPAPKEAQPAAAPESRPAPASQETIQEPRHDADYLHNPKPPYPRASVSLGEEGVVTLRVQVSEDGKPLQAMIQKSSGFARLDRSALETLRSSWRFVPATMGGKPVVAWVTVPINFSLNN